MEKNVEMIISICYILATFAFLVYNFWRAKKAGKQTEAERIKNETEQTIINSALEFIQQAEKFTNYTGEEKLNWVLTRLKTLNQNLYKDNELVELINYLVNVTNNVNIQKKEGVKNE